eukprot:GHVL01041616.1.p1 GENE.GHVL01041616.1~~GHVL01041616.1.p1  ORF type:complete len:119 (-),score=22.84 GHVL01041616.1:321-647(-)
MFKNKICYSSSITQFTGVQVQPFLIRRRQNMKFKFDVPEDTQNYELEKKIEIVNSDWPKVLVDDQWVPIHLLSCRRLASALAQMETNDAHIMKNTSLTRCGLVIYSSY